MNNKKYNIKDNDLNIRNIIQSILQPLNLQSYTEEVLAIYNIKNIDKIENSNNNMEKDIKTVEDNKDKNIKVIEDNNEPQANNNIYDNDIYSQYSSNNCNINYIPYKTIS
ncbi:hypothetical protein SLOPH_569, partial [Spraguea lophii 42_110]